MVHIYEMDYPTSLKEEIMKQFSLLCLMFAMFNISSSEELQSNETPPLELLINQCKDVGAYGIWSNNDKESETIPDIIEKTIQHLLLSRCDIMSPLLQISGEESPINWFVNNFKKKHVKFYGTWTDGNEGDDYLGSFQFNDEIIDNYYQYLEELYAEDLAVFYDFLIIPTNQTLKFYTNNNNDILTNNKRFKISNYSEQTRYIKYYPEPFNCNEFLQDKIKDLKFGYLAPPLAYVFFPINLYNIGEHQDTFLTYLLNTGFPDDKSKHSSLFTALEILIYPELLVNEENGERKTALQIAYELLASYKEIDNQQYIEYCEKIIEQIIQHPLYEEIIYEEPITEYPMCATL